MELDMNKLVEEQQEMAKKIEFDMAYTDGFSVNNQFVVNDNNLKIISGSQEQMIISNNGATLQGNLSTGSVPRQVTGVIQQEGIFQEFYIPSSIVTPFPDKLPFQGIINAIMYIVKLGEQLDKLASGG